MRKNYKNITVLRNGAMGDFILTLPALASLRAAYPTAHLRLIGHPAFLALAAPDAVFNSDSASMAPLYSPVAPLPKPTRALFAATDFILAYAADPDQVLEQNLRNLVGDHLLCHDPRPPAGAMRHITAHLLAPLRQAGLIVPDPMPRIQLKKDAVDFAQDWWQQKNLEAPVVILHPGSGGRHKCWPLEGFIQLANAVKKAGFHPLLLHGPADTHIAAQLAKHVPPGALLPTPGPARLAALLQKAQLFIGNDSGPAHMAAAVDTQTIVLFGPTDPCVWRPPHPHVEILQAPNGDLNALQTTSVLKAVKKHLDLL